MNFNKARGEALDAVTSAAGKVMAVAILALFVAGAALVIALVKD